MPDDNTIQLPAVQAAPAPAPKVYQSVEEVIGVYDTARFEHFARIANIMATGEMIPETIWTEGTGNSKVRLPDDLVKARCFKITNFAYNNRIDPFSAADCASFVHGRLCWEGKFIDGILQERHGIYLEAEYFDATGYFDPFEEPVRVIQAGDSFGIRLSGMINGQIKRLAGMVGQWKTDRAGSPWKHALNWPKMLKYRGTREWCRLYKAGVIAGILTDDEMESFVDWRSGHDVRQVAQQTASQSLVQRLAANKVKQADGYRVDHVDNEVPRDSTETGAPVLEDGPGDAQDLTTGEGGEDEFTTAAGAPEALQDAAPEDTSAEQPSPAPRYFVHPPTGGYLIIQPGNATPGGDDIEEVSEEVFREFKAKSDAEAAAKAAEKKPSDVAAPEDPPFPGDAAPPVEAVVKAAPKHSEPKTAEHYFTYASLWIANAEEVEPMMTQWKAESKLRTKLGVPMEGPDGIDALRSQISKRREQINLKKAGRA